MKRTLRGFISLLLVTTLFSAAITTAAITVSSPNNIKSSLEKSGLYDNLVDNVIQEAKTESSSEREGGEDIDLVRFKAAAEEALPPNELKNISEQVIDGTYRWLNGEVATPDFQVDLSQAKQRFVVAGGTLAESHAASLPVCTPEQLQTIDLEADIFSVPCRPPGLTPNAARQQVESELSANQDFLKDPVISANTFKTEDGQSVFESAGEAPETYQRFKIAPWVLLGMALLLGVGLFLLSETRRQGVHKLAVTLASTGLMLLLGTWLISFIFDRAARPDGVLAKAVSNEFQGSILAFARAMNSLFNKTVLIYTLAYLVLGIGILLLLKFVWKEFDESPAETIPVRRVTSDSQAQKQKVS